MPALSDYPAVLYYHSSDHRVWRGISHAALRKLNRPSHILFISHLSSFPVLFYIPQHTSRIRFLRSFSAVYTATILDLCCVVKCSHISLHASMQIYMLHFTSLFTKKALNYYRSGPSNFKYHNLKKYALTAFHDMSVKRYFEIKKAGMYQNTPE